MFSKRKPEPEWPAVPASLNHNSFEFDHSQREKARSIPRPPDTAGGVTPYLGLRARLSQIWINRWTILLLLVLVRVVLLIGSLNDNIGDAKVKALSACTKVEDIGSAMASMPHYLSVGVNSLAADGITKAVSAMVEVMMLILTGIENLIFFIINFFVGTYVCLIAAFIHGSLDVAVGVVESTTKFMNDAIGTISSGITDDVGKVQEVINSAFDKIKAGAGFFGAQIDPPKIDLSKRITDLKSIKVDNTQFVKDIVSLNSTIPTFDQAANFTRNAIAIPFDLVKTVLNETYGDWEFDKSVFPLAKKEALTFCSSNSALNNFFESLYTLAGKAKIAFIVTLAVLAVLVCVPMTYLEIRRFRRQQRHAAVFSKHGFDPMDVVYISSRPMTATWGIKIASKFSGKRQLLVRWAVAYGTSLPAIFVLSLAIAGFFSCLCQFVLLKLIQREVPALANQVGNFAGDVVTTLENVSEKWAVDANGVIINFNNDINRDVLGYVTNATTAVNNTLNTFTSEMNKGLDAVFKDTILYNTVKNVMRCLIGLKVEAVERGLTWVHDHARVSFPLFPNDTFSMGAQRAISDDSDLTSFLASPSSVTTDEITAAVDKIVNILHNGIIQEALISTGLLLVYIIVVLIGVVRALASMATPDRTRAEGGQRYVTSRAVGSETSSLTGDGRPPLSPREHEKSRAEASARFPEFRTSPGESSAADEDRFARAASDEKTPPPTLRGGGKISKGLRSPGHWRSSSYGQVEDPGR